MAALRGPRGALAAAPVYRPQCLEAFGNVQLKHYKIKYILTGLGFRVSVGMNVLLVRRGAPNTRERGSLRACVEAARSRSVRRDLANSRYFYLNYIKRLVSRKKASISAPYSFLLILQRKSVLARRSRLQLCWLSSRRTAGHQGQNVSVKLPEIYKYRKLPHFVLLKGNS